MILCTFKASVEALHGSMEDSSDFFGDLFFDDDEKGRRRQNIFNDSVGQFVYTFEPSEETWAKPLEILNRFRSELGAMQRLVRDGLFDICLEFETLPTFITLFVKIAYFLGLF